MIIGIVGKPNVGKSAFFRSLTLADAESGNFPFTTIDANSGIGYVKIKDTAVKFSKHSNPREGFVQGNFRFVPSQVIDVAGLVPGANEGKGLGNTPHCPIRSPLPISAHSSRKYMGACSQ